MNKIPFSSIILAAGKSTRMNSATPKVLHHIGGLPLIQHVITTLKKMQPEKVCVIIGKDMKEVAQSVAPYPTYLQDPPMGTGHAVLQARPFLENYKNPVLILYGDTPLLTSETLQKMLAAFANPNVAVVVLGFYPDDPKQYGRLFTNTKGELEEIIEFRDATPQQRMNNFCNAGVMAIRGDSIWPLLASVKNDNAKGEYYLTDAVKLARAQNLTCLAIEAEADEVLGVNSREELAYAEDIFQKKKRKELLDKGVTLIDPLSVYFSHDTDIAADVTIEPHVFFGPGVTIGANVTIKAFSHIEGATIREGAIIGPFARLRKGSDIGVEARIGNFVEVKNTIMEAGAKANHLSYIGDAFVGAHANIGAGTITCNYDGFEKYETKIGAGAFIGSNTALVAPVTIGEGAIVGAGSVITENVAADALALTRSPQQAKPSWAMRFRNAMKMKKSKTAAE